MLVALVVMGVLVALVVRNANAHGLTLALWRLDVADWREAVETGVASGVVAYIVVRNGHFR